MLRTKKICAYFFCIVLLLLIPWFFLPKKNYKIYKIKWNSNSDSTSFYLRTQSYLENDRSCNPIKKEYVPFKIKINEATYPMHVSLHSNKSINFDCLNKADKHKTILIWSEAYAAWKAFGFGKDEIFIKHNCPVTKCEITANKSRVNESDFVIVGDGSPGLHITNPPSFRPKNQRWIFFLYEAPFIGFAGKTNFSKYNNFFNLTATYLSSSDFLTTYEGTAQMTWQPNITYKIPYSNKKKLAAALISNCWSDNSQRMNYINNLRKHIEVDVYGGCGNKRCPNSTKVSACKELIASEYKFYLAFENSICNEYITEKFFAILKYNIVPVVLGDIRNKYEEFVSFANKSNSSNF